MTRYHVSFTIHLVLDATTPDDAEHRGKDAVQVVDPTVERVFELTEHPTVVQDVQDRMADVEAARRVLEYRRQFSPRSDPFDSLREVRNFKITPVTVDRKLVDAHKRVHAWSDVHMMIVARRASPVNEG